MELFKCLGEEPYLKEPQTNQGEGEPYGELLAQKIMLNHCILCI